MPYDPEIQKLDETPFKPGQHPYNCACAECNQYAIDDNA